VAERIYDWNEVARHGPVFPKRPLILDETLRDGLQSPSARDPTLEQKVELLRLMARLGIDTVDLGLPGAGPRAQEHVERLLRVMVEERLPLRPNCAARTTADDIRPILEISERVGVAIEVTAFIGSSPVRADAERWTLETLIERTRAAMRMIAGAGLPASFVTEDTTRSHPDVLTTLFEHAIDAGATRLVLCDTCGHATPDGVRNLIEFTHRLLRAFRVDDRVAVDWHGHNDRGQALTNALFALECGVDRVHACGLGVGERVGNTPTELLLLNLRLLGAIDPTRHDLSCLIEYTEKVAAHLGVEIPPSYPLAGRDAFRTATGVHAAAVIKARAQGADDLVYSSVPAREFGRRQEVAIGHYSGRANVLWWLAEHGYPTSGPAAARLLAHAKDLGRVLSDDEIHAFLRGAP
jgi:2-isopropylmalate synthase